MWRGFQPALGSLAKQVIADDKSGHCLNHGNGPGKHAGVMSASSLELGIGAGIADGRLLGHDGGGGLEGNPKDDGLPVGYASLDPTRTIGVSANSALLHVKMIHPGQVVDELGLIMGH